MQEEKRFLCNYIVEKGKCMNHKALIHSCLNDSGPRKVLFYTEKAEEYIKKGPKEYWKRF